MNYLKDTPSNHIFWSIELIEVVPMKFTHTLARFYSN